MPSTRFNFVIRGSAIPPRKFAQATQSFAQLLEDIDRELSSVNQRTLNWVVGEVHSGSSVVVEYVGQPRSNDISPIFEVPKVCVDGISQIESKPLIPRGFGFDAIAQLQRIADIASNGVSSFGVRAPDAQTESEITFRSSANTRTVIGQAYSLGGIEGQLEALNIHEQPRFTIWDSVTKRAVRCHFEMTEIMDLVIDSLGKKVLVVGRVRRDAQGVPREIREISHLRVLGTRDERGVSVTDLPGIYKDMVGDTLDYLAEIRGE